jgi:hypothetical protein
MKKFFFPSRALPRSGSDGKKFMKNKLDKLTLSAQYIFQSSRKRIFIFFVNQYVLVVIGFSCPFLDTNKHYQTFAHTIFFFNIFFLRLAQVSST